jgi:hypothetical protein
MASRNCGDASHALARQNQDSARKAAWSRIRGVWCSHTMMPNTPRATSSQKFGVASKVASGVSFQLAIIGFDEMASWKLTPLLRLDDALEC